MFFNCSNETGTELFIVEGRSAAEAVNRVRSRQSQAVLSLQGKVPNCATTAGMRKALKNPHIRELLSVLFAESGELHFETLLILCDADADGQHARALLTVFFQQHLPDLVNRQVVYHLYPPLYQQVQPGTTTPRFLWNREDGRTSVSDGRDSVITYFKGIASMTPESLWATCIDPEQRTQRAL